MPLEEYRRKRRFAVTPEPEGKKLRPARRRALAFVVQKHRATALHYDFRLEWDGVMLSWAVPKGPSYDPAVKRLAMQVEDHPIEYNRFEGIIPEGEYGGGTVMIWDNGTWEPEAPDVAKSLKKGDLKFRLDGKKLHGSWVLVRTRGRKDDSKPAWLLIKHRDEWASTEDDRGARAALGRLQPAPDRDRAGRGRQRREGRRRRPAGAAEEDPEEPGAARPGPQRRQEGRVALGQAQGRHLVTVRRTAARVPFRTGPMLATLVEKPFHKPGWVYEEKYDGYRILAYKEGDRVTLLSRNGKDHTESFADVARAVETLKDRALLLDGEVVAFDRHLVSRFQLLQEGEAPLVYAVFDCLYRDGKDLRGEPLPVRRAALEAAIGQTDRLFPSRRLSADGLKAFALAGKKGFEGMVGKNPAAPYREGRSTEWLKVKIHQEEELVIGGYTAARGIALAFRRAPARRLRAPQARLRGKCRDRLLGEDAFDTPPRLPSARAKDLAVCRCARR